MGFETRPYRVEQQVILMAITMALRRSHMGGSSLGMVEADPSTGSGQAPAPGPSGLGTTLRGGRALLS